MLTNIIPPSSFFQSSIASSLSLHTTTADSQKSVPLARAIASSILEYLTTDATGPNISSLKLETLGVTSASMVGV